MIAVVAGAQYFVTVLFSPRHGLFFRWLRNLVMGLRILREDILASVYRWGESHGGEPCPITATRQTAGGGWSFFLGLWLLKQRRQIILEGSSLRLAPAGRELATKLVRSHRLWETFLSEQVGLPADHLHEPAMRMEHYVTPELEQIIEEELKDFATDPHGKPIPGRPGGPGTGSAAAS
jgi:hypothetical protein